jgi:hypothetical protein
MAEFDIEKARDELGELENDNYRECEIRNLLDRALDEIERLRTKPSDANVTNGILWLEGLLEVKSLRLEADEGCKEIADAIEAIRGQAKHIEVLQAALIEAKAGMIFYEQEIGDACLERKCEDCEVRAWPKGDLHAIDSRPICGSTDHYYDLAREQLRVEGLI